MAKARHPLLIGLTVLFMMLDSIVGLNNGLARTPPMGWLSWERFLCNIDCKKDPKNCISERLYMDMADRLVEDGYRDVGYVYVNIDDCWMNKTTRDKDGRLIPDQERFPSGIKALADYMHSKGLKLGIYQDCGSQTCAGYPGSKDHFDIDAQTFADWGVDMLKLDGCYADPEQMDNIYPQMTAALEKTKRPILFSCSWPDYQREKGIKPNYSKIAEYCNMWRNYNDIGDSWVSVKSIMNYESSVQDDIIPYTGPGRWNDPDMLIIGNFGLSYEQSKTQMAVWSILAAPLLMSNDLRDLKPEYKKLLQNKYIIAVNQDELGIMGRLIHSGNQVQIWSRPIAPAANGTQLAYSYALVYVNLNEIGGPMLISAPLSTLGLAYPKGYIVRDLFDDNKVIGQYKPSDKLSLTVNPTGVAMVTATVNA